MMKPKILVVDDDPVIREGLVELMQREGYETCAAGTCAQAWEALALSPDLLLLDVALPDGDGFSFCREMRSRGMDTPVLFLTAFDQEDQVVKGLDSGGDDYIAKPFRMRELLSRVRARLRRTEPSDLYCSGDLTIDFAASSVQTAEGEHLLTPTELRLLSALVRNAGRPLSRETLLGRIWDDAGTFVDDNTLTVNISRLREKVGVRRIETVRGVGYRWTE